MVNGIGAYASSSNRRRFMRAKNGESTGACRSGDRKKTGDRLNSPSGQKGKMLIRSHLREETMPREEQLQAASQRGRNFTCLSRPLDAGGVFSDKLFNYSSFPSYGSWVRSPSPAPNFSATYRDRTLSHMRPCPQNVRVICSAVVQTTILSRSARGCP